jgi:zinc resistance-associated protein
LRRRRAFIHWHKTSVEEHMLKPVIAAGAVLAIAGSSIVYAQHRFGDHDGFGRSWGPRAEQQHRPSAEDMAAFTDARIAALKAGLELTPDQAKNWPAFEQALRDAAQLRIQLMQARQAATQQGENAQPQQGQAAPQQGQAPANPFDRLGRRADALAKASAALKKVADTGAPLYQSLTDAQKARFTRLAHMLRPHFRRFAFNERDGGFHPGGHGFRRDGEGFGPGHHRFGPNGPAGEGAPGSQL